MKNREELPLVTERRLARDLESLGLRSGSILMCHASLRAIGWVVGGPDSVLRAARAALGPDGTLSMYVGWGDGTYDLASLPADAQRTLLDECPAFDAQTSRAAWRDLGLLTECLRTTPGARRSAHPEASVAAIGVNAGWLTEDHPLQYGFGPGSPFARLVEARGDVLLLGSPRGAVTMLHYAEHLARIPEKRIVKYRSPILVHGERRWVDVEELDTVRGIAPWHRPDYFEDLVDAYLARGHGRTGLVGAAQSHLFDAADLSAFAVRWMEDNLVRPQGRFGRAVCDAKAL
jgi:aminoglycoside 3-N-acetyltransferase